jgi:uncharacterized protein
MTTPAPDKRIVKLFRQHHIFTLATSVNDQPWCATCFYVYDEENARLIFTSDLSTRHIAEGTNNPSVAGAIALETLIIGKIRGLQFTGQLTELTGQAYSPALKLYLHRFPYAAPFIKETALWALALTQVKMTDNRLGFGTKLHWPPQQ